MGACSSITLVHDCSIHLMAMIVIHKMDVLMLQANIENDSKLYEQTGSKLARCFVGMRVF